MKIARKIKKEIFKKLELDEKFFSERGGKEKMRAL